MALHLETALFEYWDGEALSWTAPYTLKEDGRVEVTLEGQRYSLEIIDDIADVVDDQGEAGEISGVWMLSPGKERWPAFPECMQPGESFAKWMIAQIEGNGFELGAPIGEDWGWGFNAHRDDERYWIALSFAGVSETKDSGYWVVSVTNEPKFRLANLFKKKSANRFQEELEGMVFEVLRTQEGVAVRAEEV